MADKKTKIPVNGDLVDSRMKAKGFSDHQLAKYVRCSHWLIGQIRKGVGAQDIDILRKICEVLELPENEVFAPVMATPSDEDALRNMTLASMREIVRTCAFLEPPGSYVENICAFKKSLEGTLAHDSAYDVFGDGVGLYKKCENTVTVMVNEINRLPKRYLPKKITMGIGGSTTITLATILQMQDYCTAGKEEHFHSLPFTIGLELHPGDNLELLRSICNHSAYPDFMLFGYSFPFALSPLSMSGFDTQKKKMLSRYQFVYPTQRNRLYYLKTADFDGSTFCTASQANAMHLAVDLAKRELHYPGKTVDRRSAFIAEGPFANFYWRNSPDRHSIHIVDSGHQLTTGWYVNRDFIDLSNPNPNRLRFARLLLGLFEAVYKMRVDNLQESASRLMFYHPYRDAFRNVFSSCRLDAA